MRPIEARVDLDCGEDLGVAPEMSARCREFRLGRLWKRPSSATDSVRGHGPFRCKPRTARDLTSAALGRRSSVTSCDQPCHLSLSSAGLALVVVLRAELLEMGY